MRIPLLPRETIVDRLKMSTDQEIEAVLLDAEHLRQKESRPSDEDIDMVVDLARQEQARRRGAT